MLLAMGQTAYFGPASDSLEHFARLGFKPDGLVNPADYLLEVHTTDWATQNFHIMFQSQNAVEGSQT